MITYATPYYPSMPRIPGKPQGYRGGQSLANLITLRQGTSVVIEYPLSLALYGQPCFVIGRAEILQLMIIPQEIVISLLFFVADTFPDQTPPASVDVTALIQRAQRGDREAVAILYEAYTQTIFRYIVVRVPTTADAEDLTAEVFVSMVKGLPTYQVTGAPFEAWLYRIAAARVADFYRQTHRSQQTELSENLQDGSLLPEEEVLQKQTLDQLRRVLQELPEEYQTILILRFVERKSHEEVALLLDKSVTAVKSAQHRALTRLAELLGSEHKARHYLRGQS